MRSESGVEKARRVFQEAGLAFPMIPDVLAVRLEEKGDWLFSTRKIDMSPYSLQHYVHEVDEVQREDYALLSHTGHGVNSYALQYYLVHDSLRIFLHLGWGGVYMNAQAAAAQIRECFSLVDEIVLAAKAVGRVATGDRLTIVASDLYGSYWSPSGEAPREKALDEKRPAAVLTEALHWLRESR